MPSSPSDIFGPGFPFSLLGDGDPYFPDDLFHSGPGGVFHNFGDESARQGRRSQTSSRQSDKADGAYPSLSPSQGVRSTDENVGGSGGAHTSRGRRRPLRSVCVTHGSGRTNTAVSNDVLGSSRSHGSTSESARAGDPPSGVSVSVRSGPGASQVGVRPAGDGHVVHAGNRRSRYERSSHQSQPESAGGSFWSRLFCGSRES
jgi:hypothetical protein